MKNKRLSRFFLFFATVFVIDVILLMVFDFNSNFDGPKAALAAFIMTWIFDKDEFK